MQMTDGNTLGKRNTQSAEQVNAKLGMIRTQVGLACGACLMSPEREMVYKLVAHLVLSYSHVYVHRWPI